MAWDSVWEKIYKSREWGKYPPEELIRFVAKNYYSVKNRKKIKILEIGCGTGANAWYLAREGFSVYGIDGSKKGIEDAQKRLRQEKLKAQLVVGDINKLPWPDNFFDCIIDIECLSCNSEEDTEKMLEEIYRVLKSGGKHFAIAAKAGCWGYNTGKQIDETTRDNAKTGPYANFGTVRFATLKSLETFYRKFNKLEIEYIIRSTKNRKKEVHKWSISCQK